MWPLVAGRTYYLLYQARYLYYFYGGICPRRRNSIGETLNRKVSSSMANLASMVHSSSDTTDRLNRTNSEMQRSKCRLISREKGGGVGGRCDRGQHLHLQARIRTTVCVTRWCHRLYGRRLRPTSISHRSNSPIQFCVHISVNCFVGDASREVCVV
uniref:BHLH domain-containing protein n=1 Tax=Parascaris univalens TaxID=6257 RepID=A0A914ZUG2_PARUN